MATGSSTGTPISSGTLWAERTDGDTYFATRHNVSTLWSSLSDSAKTALLTTAQSVIQRHPRWKFTDSAGVALATTAAMQAAVLEQVMMYLLDPDEERRSILRAQGVVSAGIVQEAYAGSGRPVIAPRVADLLRDYQDPYYNVIEFE